MYHFIECKSSAKTCSPYAIASVGDSSDGVPSRTAQPLRLHARQAHARPRRGRVLHAFRPPIRDAKKTRPHRPGNPIAWDLFHYSIIRSFPQEAVTLQLDNVSGLRSAVALRNVEFYGLAFVQRLEAVALDCGVMNEHVFAVLNLDEAVAFLCVKPLNCSFQCNNLLKMSAVFGGFLHYIPHGIFLQLDLDN